MYQYMSLALLRSRAQKLQFLTVILEVLKPRKSMFLFLSGLKSFLRCIWDLSALLLITHLTVKCLSFYYV